jgi:hypothetical protein
MFSWSMQLASPGGFDFDGRRKFATYEICFIHNGNPRMPNLFERVAHNPVSGMCQTRIPPTQDNGDLSSEVLLRAVDAGDVRDPNSDRDVSWSGLCGGPINHRGHFRAARKLDRHR